MIWWDWSGTIYYDKLPSGQTINSKPYCEHLEDLKKAVLKIHPELRRNVFFYIDNARPHVALVTLQKLEDFG